MQNLNINKGCKSYSINGDENTVITVKTTDFTILNKLSRVEEHIGGIVREMEKIDDGAAPEAYLAAVGEADQKIKAELDEVFDSPVSAAVFGEMNCLSFAGGQPVALNFLEAIIPEIAKDLEKEQKAAAEKIGKYTDAVRKYE